jgi:hypothetical protein
VRGELGKGATATVYLCDDPESERQVAVKVIRFGQDSAAMSRRMRKLFQNEGMVSKRLDHPNIVRVFDAVVEEDFAYLAMEYIQGFTLEDCTAVSTSCCPCIVLSALFSSVAWRLTAPIAKASSIATSSRPTSWLPPTTSRKLPISASRLNHEQKYGSRLDLHYGRWVAGLYVAGADQGLSAQSENGSCTPWASCCFSY